MSVRSVASHAYVVCVVHRTQIPRAAAHEHHEAPRAAGGTDALSNLVWLCATCHQVAHRVGQLRQLGRAGEAEAIATSSYPNPKMRQRFYQVVSEMVTAHALADVTGAGKPNAEVVLELPHDVYNGLKSLASEHRVNGQRVGVAKYINAILRSHVIKHGIAVKPQT